MSAPEKFDVLDKHQGFLAVTGLLGVAGPSVTVANKLTAEELTQAVSYTNFNIRWRPGSTLKKGTVGTKVAEAAEMRGDEMTGVTTVLYKVPGYRNLVLVWLGMNGERL
jgi:hypothetical protein